MAHFQGVDWSCCKLEHLSIDSQSCMSKEGYVALLALLSEVRTLKMRKNCFGLFLRLQSGSSWTRLL
jgi:hypothetical protein